MDEHADQAHVLGQVVLVLRGQELESILKTCCHLRGLGHLAIPRLANPRALDSDAGARAHAYTAHVLPVHTLAAGTWAHYCQTLRAE